MDFRSENEKLKKAENSVHNVKIQIAEGKFGPWLRNSQNEVWNSDPGRKVRIFAVKLVKLGLRFGPLLRAEIA